MIFRRMLAGLLGLTLLAAAVLAFGFDTFGLETKLGIAVGQKLLATQNVVSAKPLSLVCPGGGFVEAPLRGSANKFYQVGAAAVAVNQNGSRQNLTAAKPITVAAAAGASGSVSDVSAVQGSALLSVNQIQAFKAAPSATSNGANGLIGADCVRPSSDFWFLGASTAVGRQALLIVTNPSPVDATFDLELFDEGGIIAASGTAGLAVPAGKTLVTPLAAFAPSDATLALHLQSQGGAVGAWIQQKTVRGTVAAGLDMISPLGLASQTQVIPGVTIVGSKAAAAIAKINPDYRDLAPVVRVFVPMATAGSAKTVDVTVLVSGINSKTFGTVVRQSVQVGHTTDIALSGLADGAYAAVVSAAKPLLAAAKISRNSPAPATVLTSAGSDFTWLGASEPMTTIRRVAVPKFGNTTVSLVNNSFADSNVILKELPSGKTKSFALLKNALAAISVTSGSIVEISATTPIFAKLTTVAGAGVTSFSVLDSKNLGGRVSVFIH